MRVDFATLRWGLHRVRAGRSPDIRDIARESREICPEEVVPGRPAIFADGALGRVTALSPWRSWEGERPLIEGAPQRHLPSTAHLVERVEISGPRLFSGPARAQPGFEGAPRAGERVRLEEAHLVSSWTGSRYFGHFLWENLPLEMLPPEGAPAIAVPKKAYQHEAGYRALLGLPAPRAVASGRVARLTLYTDFAQNSHKAGRLAELRRRMRATLGPPDRPAPPGVYLRRGRTGEPRPLANEAEIEALLARLGFDILEPEALSAEEIARRSLDAAVVAGVEGSQFSHALFTVAEGGAFLVLQPPDRFAMAYKEFTDALGLGFAFAVGHPAAGGGFRVDPNEVRALLERLP